MKINIYKLNLYIFICMLFCASIPYIAYSIVGLENNVDLLGSITYYDINVNRIGGIFVYLKDILALILLLSLITRIKVKDMNLIFSIFFIISYGIVCLFVTGLFELGYVIAGIRTFIFFIVTILFCNIYKNSIFKLESLSKVMICIKISIIIEFLITLLQVFISNSFFRIGNGAYRFIGAFAGSGNLGCFGIAAIIYLAIMNSIFNLISKKNVVIYSSMILFFVMASGTRTTIILTVLCFVYLIINILGSFINFHKTTIYSIVMILILFGLEPFLSYLINKTGRGELFVSGSGRLNILSNIFNNSTIFELVFGHGLGYGTNASITLGVKGTQVSDATFNLILGQFGIIGLCAFIAFLCNLFLRIVIKTKNDRFISFIIITTIISMCLVGNFFEHIAMCIILTYSICLLIKYKQA